MADVLPFERLAFQCPVFVLCFLSYLLISLSIFLVLMGVLLMEYRCFGPITDRYFISPCAAISWNAPRRVDRRFDRAVACGNHAAS